MFFIPSIFSSYYITNCFIMSFTRFHDDPHRIKKQNEESSFAGRYMLNVPGPGENLPFIEDAQIRLQRWGANLQNNTVDLDGDLRGLTRRLNRDLTHENDYKKQSVYSAPKYYHSNEPFIQESRASHPAWIYKDLEQTRWETPLLNPLNGLEKGFHENIQTRILEKDNHITKMPVVNDLNNYYLTGNSICISGNEESCPGTLYSRKIN